MIQNNQNLKSDDTEQADLKDDLGNVALLLFLYLLQGESAESFNLIMLNASSNFSLAIPIGISYAIPILLQNRGVSYADQAAFSFAFYPFTSEYSNGAK